ncbi:MAG TPA: ribosome biogenesis GTPase Der [Phycisphaerae bacterium]|nr:ribosome biogenesis GTPase Der [Phycisphaerae bacterium]HNU44681.1 ribosome biogenesis GTPase Der [Phycisphaerae bacterium]
MALPVVAIVGRPNVGKSSLFNLLTRRRISIVDPTAGVTRDRVTAICQVGESYYELVDTGGYGIVDRDDLSEHIERQIEYAVARAQLVLFVVDAREGLTPLDRATAELLRRLPGRVRVLANKVEDPRHLAGVGEFVALGFGEAMPVSALHGDGRSALLEYLESELAGLAGEMPAEPEMKIAIVGKRNAGKSTLVNALAGEERVIVSEVPGTTRDAIDVRFEVDGRTLVAIDTAGVRKKRRLADDVEFYAFTRAEKSIRRADVVLLLIDATVPVGQVDKKLAQMVLAEHKPAVLVVNKWDLAKGKASTPEYGKYLQEVLPYLDFAPVTFTTARDGRNIHPTIEVAGALFKQARQRVGTGQLNQLLQEAIAENQPRPRRGRKTPRVYYATQVAVAPPTIVVFVNVPTLVTPNYERFLQNRLRDRLPFEEVPIRLLFRARRGRAAAV